MIMIISKHFSQKTKMHLCLQIYLIPIPETLIHREKQTSPETKGGSIKHNNCKGQYNLLVRVYVPNMQLDN